METCQEHACSTRAHWKCEICERRLCLTHRKQAEGKILCLRHLHLHNKSPEYTRVFNHVHDMKSDALGSCCLCPAEYICCGVLCPDTQGQDIAGACFPCCTGIGALRLRIQKREYWERAMGVGTAMPKGLWTTIPFHCWSPCGEPFHWCLPPRGGTQVPLLEKMQ